MISVLSIDWLSLFCTCPLGHFGGNAESALRYRWKYKKREYGTPAFKEVYDIYLGRLRVCDVQCEPRNGLMRKDAILVKFANAVLYRRDLFDLVDAFLDNHLLEVHNITRLDLCCDFNELLYGQPDRLIVDFLNSVLRHKGRGRGTAYFVHYNKGEKGGSVQRLVYNGLSFGSHTSDVRVYMYNKTWELLCEKDKPYIRDTWKAAGLDTAIPVWRIEVSLKSDGMKFVDKDRGYQGRVTLEDVRNEQRRKELYFSYVRKYFSFVRNDHPISNITREPLIPLIAGEGMAFNLGLLREVGCSNQADKVFVKALHTAVQRYPFAELDADLLKVVEEEVAHSVDLTEWRLRHVQEWNEPYEFNDKVADLERHEYINHYDLGI